MAMTVVLIAILVLAAIAAFAVALARSGRRQAESQHEIIPGQASDAPAAWAGAHTPEARLHRRLGALVKDLRSSADAAVEDADDLERRVDLEQRALDLDRRLIAAAGRPLPRGAGADRDAIDAREGAVARLATEVAELETLAAAHVAGLTPAEGLLDRIGREVSEAVDSDPDTGPQPGSAQPGDGA